MPGQQNPVSVVMLYMEGDETSGMKFVTENTWLTLARGVQAIPLMHTS